jgi:hypothetical protein
MKTCPNCGAENRQTAAECRMCAAPLESPEHLLGARMETPFSEEMPASDIISGREPRHQRPGPSPSTREIVCPGCKGVNEPDWVFCQYCGNRLAAPEPSRPQSGVSPPASPVGAEAPVRADTGPPILPTRSDAVQPASPARAVAPPPAPPVRPEAPPQASEPASPPASPPGPRPDAVPVVAAPPAIEGRAAMDKARAPRCSACGQPGSTGGLYCAYCGRPMSPGAGTEQKQSETGSAVIQTISEGGQAGETYTVDKAGTLIGRVEGDATFPHDGYLSSRHAQIVARGGRYFLVDLNSRNGTFIRIKDEVELKPGDTFLVGKQLFKFGRSK